MQTLMLKCLEWFSAVEQQVARFLLGVSISHLYRSVMACALMKALCARPVGGMLIVSGQKDYVVECQTTSVGWLSLYRQLTDNMADQVCCRTFLWHSL